MRSATTQRKKSPARAIAPGATVGRFRVVRVVARRPGIDTVVEAKAESGARVSLTVLGEAFDGDPALRSTTLKLVRTRAELEHPNLLPLRGPWLSSGHVFYASGPPGHQTLADRLRLGPMAPAEALRICGQVASALQLGAAKGLVHHDLSPAAIVLKEGEKPHALLGDFGISSVSARGCELLQRNGDVDHRSPEELRGEPAKLRSSVYSLACILLECLTGAPAHRHERPLLTLHAHLVEPPPRISQNGLPARIDAVIAKAMAKSPRERFETPAELMEAAGKALGVEVRVPVSEVERQLRTQEKVAVRERRRATRRERRQTAHRTPVRRQPSRVAVLAGVALFASAMSGFATGSADWSGDGGDRAPRAATGTSSADAAAAAERHATHKRQVSYLRAVHGTVVRLNDRRAKARHQLRDARGQAGQAASAGALAAAYRDARQSLPEPPSSGFADARLGQSMRAAERAYGRLARAARQGSGAAWKTAGQEAVSSEQQVAQALRRLQSDASAS